MDAMIRQLLEGTVKAVAPWFVAGVTAILLAVLGPVTSVYGQARPDPGIISETIALVGVVGFLAVTVYAVVRLLDTIGIQRVVGELVEFAGYRYTAFVRWILATLITFLLWVGTGYNPVATSDRLGDGVATLLGMFGSEQTVGLETVTFGLTGSPLVELIGLLTVLVVVTSIVGQFVLGLPAIMTALGSGFAIAATPSLAAVGKIPLLPFPVWVGFLMAMVQSLVVLGVILYIVYLFLHIVQASVSTFDEGNLPKLRYALQDGFVLILLVGLMSSPFAGFVVWWLYYAHRIGGLGGIRNKIQSPREQDPARSSEVQE